MVLVLPLFGLVILGLIGISIFDAAFRPTIRRLALRNGGRYARAVTNIPYQDFVLRSLRSGRVVG